MRFEKILKREIRNSGLFDDEEINIIGVKSNTLGFSFNLIKSIIEKDKLDKKINLYEYNNISEIKFLNKKSMLVLPIEGVFLSFLIYFYKRDDKFKIFIKKDTEYFYNIAYKISEYYLSNKETIFEQSYYNLNLFVYDLIKIKEKYFSGLSRILEEIGKNI